MRLLLVEDDEMVGKGLQAALKQSGYTVDWVQDGNDAVHSFKNDDYKLIILDLGLPGKSGMEVLQDIRKEKSGVPVLILTAQWDVNKCVEGLDAGADDYMVKPFALEEIEARIRLLLRRKDDRKQNLIEVANIKLDTVAKCVTLDGKQCELSAREYTLLLALMQNSKAILSRAQLESQLYGWNEEIASNAIEVHIHQLRQKLGKDAIVNVRGLGYKIKDE